MVDELRTERRRIATLSGSSRSNDEFGNGSTRSTVSSDDDESLSNSIPVISKKEKTRKQSIHELRNVFDDNPELYGIRRSGRARNEPARFEAPQQHEPTTRKRHRLRTSYSGSTSSDGSSVSRSVWQNGQSSGRTRGNRVNYKTAFEDENISGDEEIDIKRSSDRRARLHVPVDGRLLTPRFAHASHGMSDSEQPNDHNENISGDEPSDSLFDERTKHSDQFDVDEEVDVIEEVLTHAVRRLNATGNPSTLYNIRLEKDPNEGFNPVCEKGEIQYLVKWRSWSHIHSTWETEESLKSVDRGCGVDGLKRLYAYQTLVKEREKRERLAERDELDALAYEDERNDHLLSQKMKVDHIVAHSRDREVGLFDYLVKWQQLDYRYCTWESGKVVSLLFQEAIDKYTKRRDSSRLPNLKHEYLRCRPKFLRLHNQPSYIGSGNPHLKLRDYQLKGINWIAHAWTRGNSAILADEMGLGKTIQTIGFLSLLHNEYHLYGPFLLVVPLSTVGSWQSELELWASDLTVIVYTGDHVSRQFIREHEWSSGGGSAAKRQLLKFNVCITTYEILLKDKSWLGQIPWAFLGVDEAHRLKNDASQLYKTLFAFNTNSRLLVTGTPLQNSLKELWSLLHFLMPSRFPDWEAFEEAYSVVSDITACHGDEPIRNLHRALEPFLLRRIKKDVEQSLPAKIERVLRVEMAKRQATIYRLILARNYEGLLKVTKGHKASFINIVMELKKCCNHADLIGPLPESEKAMLERRECLWHLTHGSGKLMLLDKLLEQLKPKGHRVLIFSQMVRMLDILAEYLSLRGWGFQRLDGSIRGELRKQSLDHFNAEGSTDFCFLLSTRAGGLGVNLATADTVVIFDSDWNPQNDIQAQARAHRIGQTKQVSVYRLVTKDSVEEKIIESATRKMVLDHLVIQRMDTAGKGYGKRGDSRGQVLSEILRYGAETLFKQNEDETADPEVDIDDILNRAETRNTDDVANASNPANVLLSAFNVVTLDQLEQDDSSKQPVLMEPSGKGVGSGKAWSEIIPSDLREQMKSNEAKQSLLDLELGPRRRRQVKTFQAGQDREDSSSESVTEAEYKGVGSKLTDKEIRALVRAVRRFARPLERIDAIAAEAELPERTSNEVRDVVESVLAGCQSAMEAASSNQEDSTDMSAKSKGPVFYYGKVAVAAKPLLQSLQDLEILHKFLPSTSKEARLNYELPFLPKFTNWTCTWDAADDARLLTGVYEHGYDNWESIKLDCELGLGSKLLPVASNERPQPNHIRTRVDYLLKMLKKNTQLAIPIESSGTANAVRKSRNDALYTSDPKQGKHKHRGTAEGRIAEGSRGIIPKSAEFVDTDDDSSDSTNEDGPAASSRSRSKGKSSERRSKHTDSHNALKQSSDREATGVNKKKRKRREEDCDSGPLHFTANRAPVSISKEEEEEFRQRHGALFAKCKEQLFPIKKNLKALESLEDCNKVDTKDYEQVIYGIGSHIRTCIQELEPKHDRHAWRGYFWEFVQIFSKKTAEELQRIYYVAAKKEHKTHDKKHHRHHRLHSNSYRVDNHSKHTRDKERSLENHFTSRHMKGSLKGSKRVDQQPSSLTSDPNWAYESRPEWQRRDRVHQHRSSVSQSSSFGNGHPRDRDPDFYRSVQPHPSENQSHPRSFYHPFTPHGYGRSSEHRQAPNDLSNVFSDPTIPAATWSPFSRQSLPTTVAASFMPADPPRFILPGSPSAGHISPATSRDPRLSSR